MTEFAVRTFESTRTGDAGISITPAVAASEGHPLSAYSAFLGRGERAELPAPYHEVWVVMRGHLRIRSGDTELTARAGEFVHVPEDSPGEVEALRDTTLVCVSAPAH